MTATGQALYKTPEEASAWITKARAALLHQGWTGIDDLTRPLTALDRVPRSSAEQAALDKLRNYLSSHADHLHYAERLREGRSIGSGQIAGWPRLPLWATGAAQPKEVFEREVYHGMPPVPRHTGRLKAANRCHPAHSLPGKPAVAPGDKKGPQKGWLQQGCKDNPHSLTP